MAEGVRSVPRGRSRVPPATAAALARVRGRPLTSRGRRATGQPAQGPALTWLAPGLIQASEEMPHGLCLPPSRKFPPSYSHILLCDSPVNIVLNTSSASLDVAHAIQRCTRRIQDKLARRHPRAVSAPVSHARERRLVCTRCPSALFKLSTAEPSLPE